ncbi:phytoene desaturase family protein [Amycolatopsis regifaucium]|uniref:Phytoene dehydrogenase n=1 Tax=Amycolatopsis regifaucium TaxID=546365 RepID=A0A154MKR7_9PSEU|nr:phytoene desaturase family protein [Amycolatopsis regifaucium]KZB84603.1 phytoene dehydrogenase [Amycolatopsis regifaucium]OKA11066.1 phytoene dehydrogenase [Amycolatopsis regifaucium]SFI27403.1 phytoene desaturase [Amycolatopsis regifaucium]
MRTVTGPSDHVVVIGGGLAGLTATLHLLGAGRRVTLLEQDKAPGGRAGQANFGGNTVDTGASVLTMPELLDEAFAAVGESLADNLTLTRLDPAYRARFADGSTIAVHTDAAAMEAEIRAAAGPAEAEGYRRLRRWLTELYAVQKDRFIGANFDSPLDLARPELAKLAALGGFGRLGPKIGGFLRDDRVRRLFSFQALYAGLDPARAIGAYGVISFMDTVGGVYYPSGGMGEIARALTAAAGRAGAEVRFGTEAAWLERVSSRVRAVRTRSGERIPCDTVVLATELGTAYRLLGARPRRPLPLRYSPSAVVLHGHAPRSWPDLGHHTIFFGHAWEKTFSEIIREGKLMSDPSLLVTRPTATEPGLASSGDQVISVLAPAPNLRRGKIDWDRVGPAYRAELLSTLEKRGLTGFADEFTVDEMITPAGWAERGLTAGTPFSLAHTFAQTGPFRPGNLVRAAENVVLAGCGTTPGVGIPPVVISGRLAAERVTGR